MFQAKASAVRLCTASLVLIGCSVLPSTEVKASTPINNTTLWRRARILSPGQRVWSFRTSYHQNQARLAHDVRLERVTWGQLLGAETEPQDRIQLSRHILNQGFALNEGAASEVFELRRESLALQVDWAYGLTSSWMIGFQLPVSHQRFQIRSNVEITGEQSLPAHLGSGRLRDRVRELVEAKIADAGYDRIEERQESWVFGDVNLISQNLLRTGYDWKWSLQQNVHLPTARNPNRSNYFRESLDSGNADLALTSLLDYYQNHSTFGFRFGYVAQLPDTYRDQSSLRSHHRDLGDWTWGAIDGEYRLNSTVDLSFEQSYAHKGEDHMEGLASFVNEPRERHQTRVGVSYRGEETQSGRSGLENRWMATLAYTQPWSGKSSLSSGETALELMSYF